MDRLNKLKNALDDFIDSDYFQTNTKLLRKEFNIPKNGFPITKKMKKAISQNELESIYPPGYLHKKILTKYKNKVFPNNVFLINTKINKFIEKFPIDDMSIDVIFRIYIFHNKKIYKLLDNYDIDEINLCRIEDFKDITAMIKEYFYEPDIPDFLIRKSKDYPIILKLHPEISQRDLISYIKRNWKVIKTLLDQYKDKNSKLSKTRTRNPDIQKRNDFIYKHRNLSRKELSKLVRGNFPDNITQSIDYASIGKIISLEKKRRS